MPFTTIRTEHLLIRELVANDAEHIFAYRSLPDISRFQSWGSQSVGEILKTISANASHEPDEPGSWYQVGIVLQSTGQVIGDCGFRVSKSESRQAEIGIALSPEFQSQGFATEAVRALLDYLFTLGKHRVFGSVDPRNTRSIALMQRVGMRQEAHFQKSLWFRGEWVDDVIFAMLASEWNRQ